MSALQTVYATLDQLRARFSVAPADTSDDARLFSKLRAASAQIDRYTARTFAPVLATRLFDWRNANTILFRGEDLLLLQQLINGDGNVIDPAAIIQLGGINGPLWGVEINVAKGAFLNYITTKTRALSVSGIWGWHDDYANAWKPSGDTVSVFSMTTADTTVTVNNVTGADGWGLVPRFQVGQLISIDTEYMQITSVNSGTGTLGVIRGTNGTLITVHIISAPISVYVPPVDVTEICLRWAAWLTRLEDSGEFGQTSGQTADASSGGIHVPMQIPPDIQAELAPLVKLAVTV